MMVEPSPHVSSLMRDLDKATSKLEKASSKEQPISQREVKEVMKALQNVNTTLGPTSWADKKLAPEAMKGTIERALAALALFQGMSHSHLGRTGAEQAIVSLFASLSKELKDFDKNLRTLRKHKIGKRVGKVEKVSEAKKQSRDK